MIRVFRMINGEEIIGNVKDTTEKEYVLTKAANIMVQETERGMGVGLAPYMPYTEGNILLNRSAIAAEGTPVVQMENEYNRLFGSGIQIAGAGSLAGV